RLLLITQSSSVVTSLLLGTLVVTGHVAFWHVYLISLVNATIAAFDAPGRQSLFPMLVPRGQLQNAITLNAMLFQTGQLVGPAIAGVLIARMLVLLLVGDIRRKGAFMLGSGALYATALLVFAWSRSFPLSVAVLAVLGFADATWGALRNAIAQIVAEDAYRGRVMSLILIAARGLTSASQVETGVATALFGAPGAATIGALAIGGALTAAATRGKSLRDFT